ncbi:hypothetical protein [Butyrivibrio sp. VCD2006]|uniref:hypothetical protein n=1 Tax=Butyrivibrio sp. VCD2006 TaxID=1280664 RepID=UPI0003F5C35B|nr:hypothetical protein [Butyrivibrio sp. VCD2006]
MGKKILSLKKAVFVAVFMVVFAGFLGILLPNGITASAKGSKAADAIDAKTKLSVAAKGIYSNWEGVSNVSEFTDAEGNYCYAFYKGKLITIIKNKKGKAKSRIKIRMQYPIFGAVTCDPDGYFYVVTGRKNSNGVDMKKNTVFISKYSPTGSLIATIGDNGSGCFKARYSSYYGYSEMYEDNDSNTKVPFDAGNCDIAVNGNYIAVNYARGMYNGHQSNTAIILNRHTMQFVQLDRYYNSHSFAQRAIPYQDGFILASEGDAYNRSFSVAFVTPTEEVVPEEEMPKDESWYFSYNTPPYAYTPLPEAKQQYTSDHYSRTNSYDIFHFWLQKNASSNMFLVNNNFAHMGGIAVADNNHVALVGTSVKALNKKAAKQKECLFIQIFDPTTDITKPTGYAISDTRSGKSGIMGTEDVTDYGIKWLTNGKFNVSNPQVVADHKGRFVILFEKYAGYSFQGVYYLIVNPDGSIAKKITKFPVSARLNPCETPKLSGKCIYWTGNKPGSSSLYTFKLKIK